MKNIIFNSEIEEEFYNISSFYMNKNRLKHHNLDHILRVVFFAKLIMKNENTGSSKFNEILASCYFHDISRKNDMRDNYHGINSAIIYRNEIQNKFLNLNHMEIIFSIANHNKFSSPNGELPIINNYTIPFGIDNIVPTTMWDADRIDIARIEIYRGKLNPKYLNTNFAKMFLNSTEHIDIYSQKIEKLYEKYNLVNNSLIKL